MDFNALKERIQNMNKRTVSNKEIWKPKDEHQCRLARNPQTGETFTELFFHGNLSDYPFLCPLKNFGDACEVCEFCKKLSSWTDDRGSQKPESIRKADFETFKRIQATGRLVVAMVERLDPKDMSKISEPRWWSMTAAQATSALKVCESAERLQDLGITADDADRALDVLFDPVKGFDVTVSFKKPGEKGNSKSITLVEVEGKLRPSSLFKTAEECKQYFSTLRPIEECFKRVTSDEASKMLRTFLAGGQPVAQPGDAGVKKYDRPAATKSKEKVVTAGTKSIDEAFEDL